MTVYCGMSLNNLGFRSKETIRIGFCLEYSLICLKNVVVGVAEEWNESSRFLILVPGLLLR